jgi:hypothetical protein
VVAAGWGLRHCDDGGVWRREGREWRIRWVFLLEFEWEGGGVKAGFVGGCAEGNRKLGMVSCTVHSLLPDMAST